MLEWAFVALGSNLGDRMHNLSLGCSKLAGLAGTTLVAESRVEETEPIGGVAQGNFFNQMVLLRTERSAEELLEVGHEAEREAGRIPSERWGPRTANTERSEEPRGSALRSRSHSLDHLCVICRVLSVDPCRSTSIEMCSERMRWSE